MRNTWMWVVIVVILLVGGFIWWQGMQATTDIPVTPSSDVIVTPPEPVTTAATTTDTATTTPSVTAAPMSVTVNYTDSGFSPSPITVAKGGTVTFVNKGSAQMWVATGPHPAHTGYDGDATSRAIHCAAGYTGPKPFDQCVVGTSYTFTFDKTGTWPFHNHVKASDFGQVIVK